MSVEAVHALLNDTRSHRHLPLAAPVSVEPAAAWVRDKDDHWDDVGYGPWAVTADGRLVGWGGFQPEEGGADFALVLARTSSCRSKLAPDAGQKELGSPMRR